MPTHPRIVSLIASATEIVCGLGLGERLVGRSHECDFPPAVARLPALTAAKLDVKGSSAEIDARVRQIVRDGLAVYSVDAEALRALQPDVILTQDHCDVCAVSLADVEAATCAWTGRPVAIVSLRPDCLADVYADIGRVADALGARDAGAGSARLEGTYWRLVRIGERPVTALAKPAELHLLLDGNGRRVSGSGGCNRFVGGYELDGDRITFTNLAPTRMSCPEATMLQERAYFGALSPAGRWRIDGNRLELYGPGGDRTVFEAGAR